MRRLGFVFVLLCSFVRGEVYAQGAIVLEGGGVHVAEAATWIADRTADKRILVLDYEEAENLAPRGWLLDGGFTTVDYLAVVSSAQADADTTYDTIASYSAVYLPGGGQSRYVRQWRGTRTIDALETVFASGGTLAGSSAGTAILSGVYFSASRGTVYARESLLNVRNRFITLGDDFLGVLPGILVDTHFYERGRLARLLAMLQRYREDNEADPDYAEPLGVGVDDHTAFVIGPDGIGEILGSGVVAILDTRAARIDDPDATRTLALRGVALTQLSDGYRYDLAARTIVARPDYAQATTPYGGSETLGVIEASPSQPVLLDATLDGSAWTRAGGPLARWTDRLDGDQPDVCLFTATTFTDPGLAAYLRGRGAQFTRIDLDGANHTTAAVGEAVAACAAYVFAGNDLEAAREVFGPAEDNVLRAAFAAKGPVPYIVLGMDAALLSSYVLQNAETSNDAAYRGRLTFSPGPALFYWNDAMAPRPIIVPGLYPADARASAYQYHENHLAGGFWALASTDAVDLILLPDGAAAEFAEVMLVKRGAGARPGNTILNVGAVPFLQISEPYAQPYPAEGFGFALPVRRAPTGGDGPRQNAAYDALSVNAVAPGASVGVSVETAAEDPDEAQYASLTAYPNPSADAVTLAVGGLPPGRVTVGVYDLLGRRVLRAETVGTGETASLDLTWPEGTPNGVYLARIESGPIVLTHRLIRLR